MKKLIASMAAVLLLAAQFTSLSAQELKKVRFMPVWTAQAQFAGFYMAQEKGFYREAGLDVTIEHLSANAKITAMDYLIAGNVDICTSQLIKGIMTRAKGHDVVDVLQTSQNSALMCVSHEPINTLQDFDGMKIGRWKSGFGELADIFCRDHNLNNVQWVYFLHGVNLFVSKAIDATLCYSFSEYLDLLFASGRIPKDRVYRFSDLGYNYPEDAIFVTGKYYRNNRETVDKFKEASKKGWIYAAQHPDEALEVVMKVAKDNNIMTNVTLQQMMLEEILRLQVNPDSHEADFSHISNDLYNAMIDDLVNGGFIDKPVLYNDIIKK